MESVTKVRVVIQQCLKARLQVKPPDEDGNGSEYVEIGQGMVVFICFKQNASEDTLDKIVKSVLGVKLCESKSGQLVSILDLPGDILIIPQACLGGKMKGKAVQYHGLIEKDNGVKLYHSFVELCQHMVSNNPKSIEMGTIVKNGTYGNRQVLSVDTNGPFTHVFDF
ncbi:D-aminoacyl-tRNA deacylase 2-like [Tachypleus tridentatus]|uniref:D-aminoacyl-tRNA deacylase 2-like n=1 Tax=Tachypleus tridentatus TaxID=6853 RepID=UPI003FD2B695